MNNFHMGSAKFVAVGSGKGGVGKTTLTSHIAARLAARGSRVLVLDGDLGMANVDIFFGVRPRGDLSQVLSGEQSLESVITPVSEGLDLISGGSGLRELAELSNFERAGIMGEIGRLSHRYDIVLMDTAPGLSANVLFLNATADLNLIVITPDPAAMTDSYALVKCLYQTYRRTHFSLVCNQVRDAEEAKRLYARFSDVVSKFLHVRVDYFGALEHDSAIRRSVQSQRLVTRHQPDSASAQRFDHLAVCLQSWLSLNRTNGLGVPSFWQQLTGVA